MTLLQVMLILVLLGAIVAAGFQVVQSRNAPEHALSQEKTLAWADQAIIAFAAANSRLPCPAATTDGAEDCSLKGAGYLPRQTLEKYSAPTEGSSGIGASGIGRLPGAVLYAAYRAGDVDLSVAGHYYAPSAYDAEEDAYSDRSGFTAINGLDFCAALSGASLKSYDSNALHLKADASNAQSNVAYGIAIAGQTPGDNGPFDGDNQLHALSMARPNTLSGGGYDDRVKVRTFGSLAQTMGCTQLAKVESYRGGGPLADSIPITSMDLLNEAVAIDEMTKDTQANTKDNADQTLSVAKRTVALSAIEVALASADVAAATLDAIEANVIQASSITLCILSLGIECWRVAFSTTGLTAQALALGLAVQAVPPAIVAAGLNGASLSYAQTAARMANVALGANPADLSEALAQAEAAAYGVNCTTKKGVEKCEREGLKQTSVKLAASAAEAESKRDAFNSNFMRHWNDANLRYRHPDPNASSAQISVLKTRLAIARDLVDKQMALETLQGNEKAYTERLKSYADINDPNGDFRKEMNKTCRKTDTTSQLICENYRSSIDFITTCKRADGEMDSYDPSKPASEGPYCIPALNVAIGENATRINQQKRTVSSALVNAINNRVAGYLYSAADVADNSASAYYYSYPPTWLSTVGSVSGTQWNFCRPVPSQDAIKDCKNLNSYGEYQNHVAPRGIPLYRMNHNWLSYADAYRLQKTLTADAVTTRSSADSAREAYADMVQQIADIKATMAAMENGTATPAEIWMGADQALEIADERGALGPDRKAAGTTPDAKQTRSTVTP